jgi:hypothetical protein
MVHSIYTAMMLVLQAMLLDAASSGLSSQNLFALDGQDLITDTLDFLKGNVPVPPSMRCVAVITVLYFSAYFAIILARSYGTLVGRTHQSTVRIRGRLSLAQSTETGMTDALVLAPMLCILMIGARMRAMQLDPAHGNPQKWAMSAMYIATWAFVAQFLTRCITPCVEAVSEEGSGCAVSYLLTCVWVAAIALLYWGFAAVVISVFLIEAPRGETPPVSPAMQCVTILTTVYFLIYFCMGMVRSFQQCRAWANKTEYRQHTVEKYLEHACTALQFAPMLCILAVGCRLRALQMGREPERWAQAAMFGATWAIVLQTILLILVPCLIPGENLDVQQDTKALDWEKQPHPTLKGLAIFLSAVWWASVLCLYVCIATILVSVFSMEPDPTHLFHADVKDRPLSLLAQNRLRQLDAPPVSTAMRCVTVLTLLYFGVFLVILVLRAVKEQSAQRRLEVFVDLAKQALAFVPMLCVMMIALRLRAVQLGSHDPQVFAQHTMWVATFMIIIQVVVAVPMVLLAQNEEEDNDEESRDGIWRKATVIGMLVLRYAAALGLYLSMAILIFALFAMESHPAETVSMVPDLGAFSPDRIANNKPSAGT